MNDPYPPLTIIVCAVQGDWIPWEHERRPEPHDCPFGECDCTPTVYVRVSSAKEAVA